MSVNTSIGEPKRSPVLRRGRVVGALLALGVVGFSAGFAGASASAGTAQSQTGQFTTPGYTWRDSAYIRTSTSNAQASSAISRSPVSNTPAGYMGARGRLFVNGSQSNLSCEGTTQYNQQVQGSLQGFSCTRTSHGNWNSYGVVYGYNKNSGSYQAQYTFNSPTQSS